MYYDWEALRLNKAQALRLNKAQALRLNTHRRWLVFLRMYKQIGFHFLVGICTLGLSWLFRLKSYRADK